MTVTPFLPHQAALRQAWGAYLLNLPGIVQAPYEYWGSLTYKDHAEIPRGHVEDIVARRFRYFVRQINEHLYGKRWERKGGGVWGVVATEKLLDYPHHHFIMGGEGLRAGIRRLDMMDMWEDLYGGWARIKDYKGQAGIRYIVKYVGKGGQVDVFAGAAMRHRLKA